MRGPTYSSLTLFLAMVALACSSAVASAQAAPISLRIAPEFALSLASPAALSTPVKPEPTEAQMLQSLRRGRSLLAAGVGLLAGGAGGLAVGLRGHRCYHEEKREISTTSTAGGAIVMGMGMVFSLAGFSRLNGTSRAFRDSQAPSNWLPLIGLATAATSFLVVSAIGIPEAIACSSS